MTYNEVMEAIEQANPDDWVHNGRHWTYKNDLMIRFEDTHNDDDPKGQAFQEDWARSFPDPHAIQVTYVIYYGASFVRRVDMVSVDGHRTLIPVTKSSTELVITKWQYQFAKIVEVHPHDQVYGLDARLTQAGITIQG